MLRVAAMCIAKSELQGNLSRLKGIDIGYYPRTGGSQVKGKGKFVLRLVLIQKRTRLESYFGT